MGLQLAQKKRLENISENIIHMYKTEDLIRAYNMDIDQINKYIVSNLPVSSEEKGETRKWYVKLITAMQNENIVQTGHLKAAQEVVANMESIHKKLLTEDDAYLSIYKEAQEDLNAFRKLAGENINDVQICLSAVYGLLILRLNNRPVNDSQRNSVELFGAIISYLSYKFRQKELMGKN